MGGTSASHFRAPEKRNEFVSPEKEKALFWRSIWINNGSPRQG